MPYVKRPLTDRRFYHSDYQYGLKDAPDDKEHIKKELDNIPLPNQVDDTPEFRGPVLERPATSILDIIRNRIHMEDLILIGLIFLLINEGIDDQLLLIILVYILLA